MPNRWFQPHGVNRFAAVPFLVVEDDPASARLVATLLVTEGATDVRVAHSAEEALAVLQDAVVRVLIVDVLLPGMSGLVLVRRLKSEQATRHTIAIAVSGLDGARLATEAIDSGCTALIPKPIEFNKLLAILRESLVPPANGAGEAGVTGRES